jgi:hypothetical protein
VWLVVDTVLLVSPCRGSTSCELSLAFSSSLGDVDVGASAAMVVLTLVG